MGMWKWRRPSPGLQEVPIYWGWWANKQARTRQPTTSVMGTTRPVEPAQGAREDFLEEAGLRDG